MGGWRRRLSVLKKIPGLGELGTQRGGVGDDVESRHDSQGRAPPEGGGQGVVHLATAEDAVFALKWLRPSERNADLYNSIRALVDRPSPHPSFVWPIDLVVSDDLGGFGYLMRYMEPRFISFSQMLEGSPTFRVLATVGRNLVDAFHALHTKGLCYRDISFGNLFVDPETAEVAICDNDNVGIDGGDVFVMR